MAAAEASGEYGIVASEIADGELPPPLVVLDRDEFGVATLL